MIYKLEKKGVGAPEGNDNASKQCSEKQNIDSTPKRTMEKIAEQFKVSPDTVWKAEQFSDAVDKLEENMGGAILQNMSLHIMLERFTNLKRKV